MRFVLFALLAACGGESQRIVDTDAGTPDGGDVPGEPPSAPTIVEPQADDVLRDPDVHVLVASGYDDPDGDVEVSVSDLGPGLIGEVEQKIFEPFFTTKPTGTGLGLAISRSIIKAHDARLGYRANQPRGACFYFVLPAQLEASR